jgi:hypothetical protein
MMACRRAAASGCVGDQVRWTRPSPAEDEPLSPSMAKKKAVPEGTALSATKKPTKKSLKPPLIPLLPARRFRSAGPQFL